MLSVNIAKISDLFVSKFAGTIRYSIPQLFNYDLLGHKKQHLHVLDLRFLAPVQLIDIFQEYNGF